MHAAPVCAMQAAGESMAVWLYSYFCFGRQQTAAGMLQSSDKMLCHLDWLHAQYYPTGISARCKVPRWQFSNCLGAPDAAANVG